MSEPLRAGDSIGGGVCFEASVPSAEMDLFQCPVCRCRSGDIVMAAPCGDGMTVDPAETIGLDRSSEYEERSFCRDCGASLMLRLRERSSVAVALQAFDDKFGFVFAEAIFVDEKRDHYAFANETRKRTSAGVMAQFTNEQGA